MSTKHTPGPWAYLDTGLVFSGKNRLNIAQVATTGMGYQAAGNAQLIAAAPDLLAALDGLLNALPSATTHPAIKAARAAIAAATAGA